VNISNSDDNIKSILIETNKMQEMQVFIYCVSGVYRTHHQEYIKL